MTWIQFAEYNLFSEWWSYCFRAESLASEIRDLQGELADYNTVSYSNHIDINICLQYFIYDVINQYVVWLIKLMKAGLVISYFDHMPCFL